MKILYVEDDGEAREALSRYLKRRYGRIYTANDGIKGMEIYRIESPDLVIVDLYMPNMDGLEMIKEIRKLSRDTFVIVTSAVDDVEVILKSVDLGIDKYLLKPINPEELVSAISGYHVRLQETHEKNELFETEKKRQIEDRIKKEFTSFLKASTGKGPSGVSVFINYKFIEIKAYDAFTVMEKNMIDNGQNSIIIEQYRRLFYSIQEEAIGNLIHEIIGSRVKLSHVEISPLEGVNEIIFHIL